MREGQLDERIAVHEVRKAMLRMVPGLELGAGVHVDSNSYLVNKVGRVFQAAGVALPSQLARTPA